MANVLVLRVNVSLLRVLLIYALTVTKYKN